MRGTRGAEAALFALLLLSTACSSTPSSPGPAAGLGDSGSFPADGVRLHYVLDTPSGSGPFPAVVIGQGSGRATTSDGAAYVPFLRARGFAVLRYDKRGVGQSTGTYRGVSAANSVAQVAQLGGDMAAAAAF